MKKLFLPLFLTVLLTLSLVPTSYAANEAEGIISYLSGKTIKTGTNPTNPIGTTTAVTDNNLSTWFNLKAEVASATVSDFLIYDFASPVDINAYKLNIKQYNNQTVMLGFYDKSNSKILTIDGPVVGDNGIYPLGQTISNVSKVVVWNRVSTNPSLDVVEWDVYKINFNLTASANKNSITLNWNEIDGAVSYTIRKSTTQGGPYGTVTSNVYGNSYVDNDVVPNLIYYYIVEAVFPDGSVITSNEASAKITSEPPVTNNGNRAILTIIMTTGLEKEFDLSMEEVNAFIDWYDAKENGIGPARYGIDKHSNNRGPFSKRVDYVVFKNILSFEISEYSINE